MMHSEMCQQKTIPSAVLSQLAMHDLFLFDVLLS